MPRWRSVSDGCCRIELDQKGHASSEESMNMQGLVVLSAGRKYWRNFASFLY